MRPCPHCGVHNPTADRFCNGCGASQTVQPQQPPLNAQQGGGVIPLQFGNPDAIGGAKPTRNIDGGSSLVRAKRIFLPLLILGGLFAVVFLVMILRRGDTQKEGRAQPSTESLSNAPDVGVNDVRTLKGSCDASSHTSEGALGADLTKLQSRFLCDSAVVAFLDDHNSHIMIQFSEKEANHSPILGFAGQMESDGIIMQVANVYLEPGKATPVSDGACKFFFKDRHMDGITCGIKADEGGQRTVAIVVFNAASGQSFRDLAQRLPSNTPVPPDPFEGFSLGDSLAQVVPALKQRGFPSNAPCDGYDAIDYEDCTSQRGTPGGEDFEILALHMHPRKNGRLYAVEYLFPRGRYDDVLKQLQEKYGQPKAAKGSLTWMLGTSQIILVPKSTGYAGPGGQTIAQYRLSEVMVADTDTVAHRLTETLMAAPNRRR